MTIEEKVEITERGAESQGITRTNAFSKAEALQLACDVRVNDPTYIPCPTQLEVQDYYVVYLCDMDAGACGDPPYTWVADMTNNDTTALTFTFQDELTHIEEAANYNAQAKQFLFDWALVSHTYFGVAHFTITFSNADGPQAVWGGQIVTDNDNDLIADAWENQHGGMERPMTRPLEGCSGPSDACYDDDGIGNSLLGEGQVGDGISKLDEYRGIFLPIGQGYTRLDPDSQDVFVDVDLSGYTNEANWALGQLRTQLGMSVHRINDLDLVLQGSATLPWVGEESFGVFILLNDSSATNYITYRDRWSGAPDELILERLNGYIVNQGTFYWGDVEWDDPNCVKDTNVYPYIGCQPWESMGGPRLGYTMRDGVSTKDVFVATVYPSGFEAYFDPSRNSIPESATLWFRYWATLEQPLDSYRDFLRFWRARYDGFDLDEDGNNDDGISPYDLLNEPVNGYDGQPVKNNDPVDDYVMESTFSESIRRTMLHELFHALSRRGYHPKAGKSVMRQGPGPAHVDSFLPEDKAVIDLRHHLGGWLIHHE